MDMIAHLSFRKYDVDAYQHHYIDQENQIATFYLFDEFGRWTGYQRYNPHSQEKKVNNSMDGRYFNHNLRGELCVWGVEKMRVHGPLFVTESIFKAAAIHRVGFDAITQLTSGCSDRFLRFVDSFNRKVYFVGDNDKAGIDFSKYRPDGFVTEKDLDDYETDELKWILQSRIWLSEEFRPYV